MSFRPLYPITIIHPTAGVGDSHAGTQSSISLSRSIVVHVRPSTLGLCPTSPPLSPQSRAISRLHWPATMPTGWAADSTAGSSSNVNAIIGALKTLTVTNFVNSAQSLAQDDDTTVHALAGVVVALWSVAFLFFLLDFLLPPKKSTTTGTTEAESADNILSWLGVGVVALNILVVAFDTARANQLKIKGYKA